MMPKGANIGCLAEQAGDRMTCGNCHMAWDTNDPDPPKCGMVMAEYTTEIDRAVTMSARYWEMRLMRAKTTAWGLFVAFCLALLWAVSLYLKG